MRKIEGPQGLEGSGIRALETNQSALEKARADLSGLQARADAGEIVDNEVRELVRLIERLKQDQGNINAAGM